LVFSTACQHITKRRVLHIAYTLLVHIVAYTH
jgi:hypothetical protein